MTFLEWLRDNAALIAIIFSILGVIGSILLGIWKIGRLYEKFSLRCQGWDKNGKDIEDVKKNVRTIIVYLASKDKNFLGMKNSPLILNEKGKTVYDAIKGSDFIEKNKTMLMEMLASKNPRTPLDVEISARTVFIELLNDPVFDEIKNIVYSYPAIKVTNIDGKEVEHVMTMADACFVLSIPLRDMYLADHPEINQQTDNPEQN